MKGRELTERPVRLGVNEQGHAAMELEEATGRPGIPLVLITPRAEKLPDVPAQRVLVPCPVSGFPFIVKTSGFLFLVINLRPILSFFSVY